MREEMGEEGQGFSGASVQVTGTVQSQLVGLAVTVLGRRNHGALV